MPDIHVPPLQQTPYFSDRHPYLAIFLTTVILLLAMGAAGTMLYLHSQHGGPAATNSNYVQSSFQPVWMVFPFFALWLAYQFWGRKNWALVSPRRLSDLPSRAWPPYLIPLGVLVLQVLNAGSSLNRPLGELGYYLGFTALVAFVEEGLYRGMFIKWLLPKGFHTAVIGSAVVFALTHALNLLGGQSVTATVLQIVFSLLFGLLAGLLRLRTGTLLLLMGWHMAFDFAGFIGTRQGENTITLMLECLVLIGGTVWLWRDTMEAPPALPNLQNI